VPGWFDAASLKAALRDGSMRILTFSSLYPSSAQPFLGQFVEQRLRGILALGGIEAKVVAPVPWFPSTAASFGEYAKFASVPVQEQRHCIDILHPRFPVLPKVCMSLAPFLLARAMRRPLNQLIRDGYDFDVIDAQYFYPQGVAAVMLGARFDKPVLVTGHGTDINILTRHCVPRNLIRRAANRAAAVVTVADALRSRLIEIGVRAEQISVLRNGVDLELFRPPDVLTAWPGSELPGKILLSVGNLIELKGHHLVIEALQQLDGYSLVIVGHGEMKQHLLDLAQQLDLADRVRIADPVPQAQLVAWYSAAAATILASSREGLPGVVLESMACDTPVIATNVGGISEVLATPEAGVLLPDRIPSTIVGGVRQLFAQYPQSGSVRRYAQGFDWGATSVGACALLRQITGCTEAAIGPADA